MTPSIDEGSSPANQVNEDLDDHDVDSDKAEIRPTDATVLVDGLLDEPIGQNQEKKKVDQAQEPVLSLVSINGKTAACFDLVKGALVLVPELPSHLFSSSRAFRVSCGRDASNSIVLTDSRVSSVHFTLRIRAARGGLLCVELLDQSSNGTWVNGRRVGNGRRVPLVIGDKVVVLPSAQVGQDSEIGYLLLHDVRGARCTSAELGHTQCSLADELVDVLKSPSEISNLPLSKALEPELRCAICAQALYSCLQIVPCGHNFCAPCLLRWRKSSSACPECRSPISQAVRNLSVDKVVEIFRKANPEASRSDDEIKLLDAMNQDSEYRAMLRWILREGPWTGIPAASAVPTPLRRQEPRESTRNQRGHRQQTQRPRRADTARSSEICCIC